MHGCLPSHLIFLRRHSSHALVTLLRFCMGRICLACCDPAAGLVSTEASFFWFGSLSSGDVWNCDSETVAEVSSLSSGDVNAGIFCAAIVDVEKYFLPSRWTHGSGWGLGVKLAGYIGKISYSFVLLRTGHISLPLPRVWERETGETTSVVTD